MKKIILAIKYRRQPPIYIVQGTTEQVKQALLSCKTKQRSGKDATLKIKEEKLW